MKAQWRRSQ